MGFEAILQQEYIDSAVKALNDAIERFDLTVSPEMHSEIERQMMVMANEVGVISGLQISPFLVEAGELEAGIEKSEFELYFNERFRSHEPQGELAQSIPQFHQFEVAEAGANGALPEHGSNAASVQQEEITRSV